MAQGAGVAPVGYGGANGLGVILHQQQAALHQPGRDDRVPAGRAVEVHGHDGPYARVAVGSILGQLPVEVESALIRLHEHRPQPHLGNGQHRGDVCVGGHYDAVARLQPTIQNQRPEDETDSVEAVADTDGQRGACSQGQFMLESLGLRAVQIPA